jgi:uncharacterized protein with HEPN domain
LEVKRTGNVPISPGGIFEELETLRHAYERIELEMIWHSVTDDLPQLKAAVRRALSSAL